MDKDKLLSNLKASLVPVYNIHALTEQFIEYGYKVSQHSKWTMRTRAVHLGQFAKFCDYIEVTDIRKLNIVMLDAYFTYYGESHSKSTVNTARRIIKVFTAWLINYKELVLLIKPEAIRIVKIVDNTPKSIDMNIVREVINESNQQDGLMIALIVESGVRITELVNIRIGDMSGSNIKVLGKGSIERVVHITYELSAALKSFIKEQNRLETDYLFHTLDNYGGGQLSTSTARLRIQKCFDRVADIKMYPHQLRHTFAINLLEAGCDLVTIQKLLGHTDITTTMVYLRITDSYIEKNYRDHIGKSLIAYMPIDINKKTC